MMSNNIRNMEVSPSEGFLRSLYTAAACRFTASSRLKKKGAFSFSITTMLSMGLIFIPLMQTTNLNLPFPNDVLNILQIFLAISALVYSVINSQARYGVRAEKLNECGDQIKNLARELDANLESCESKVNFDYSHYRSRYSDLNIDVENHSEIDRDKAVIELPKYYHFNIFEKCLLKSKFAMLTVLSFLIPVSIVLFEISIILDMLGVTNIVIPIFDALAP